MGGRPLRSGQQPHRDFVVRNGLGITAELRAADGAEGVGHLRVLPQLGFKARCDALGLGERNRRVHRHPDRHGSLVELRYELRAQEGDGGERRDKGQQRTAHDDPPSRESPGEGRPVDRLEVAHQKAVGLADRSSEHEAREHRYDDQRDHERAEHGESYRESHGTEQLALDTLQREEWEKYDDDDEDGEEHGLTDLLCRVPHTILQRLAAVPALRQVAHDVLHHDNRAIHHHADADRQPSQGLEVR